MPSNLQPIDRSSQPIDRSFNQPLRARTVTFGRNVKVEIIPSNENAATVSRHRQDRPVGGIQQNAIAHAPNSPAQVLFLTVSDKDATASVMLKSIANIIIHWADVIKEKTDLYLTDQCVVKYQVDCALSRYTDEHKTAIKNQMHSEQAKRAYDILEYCIHVHEQQKNLPVAFGCTAMKGLFHYISAHPQFGRSNLEPVSVSARISVNRSSMTPYETNVYNMLISQFSTKFDPGN